jgi:hypothetical protein
MPSRPPSRGASSRAEARRRARLAAQGQTVDDDVEEAATSPERPPQGGGFLSRLFPPAPPLPGHERPFEGFSYAGRPAFRGIAEAIWLLARNPLAWIGMGALWAVSRLLTDQTAIGIIMSVVSFGSLIAAGWLGWRRPWLYGLAAALLGWLAVLLVLLTLLVTNPDQAGSLIGTGPTATPSATVAPAGSPEASPAASPEASPAPGDERTPITPAGVAINIVLQTLFQAALGTAAGWYGGYLRRRTVAGQPQQRRRR